MAKAGDNRTPATLVKWLYANSNPVMYTDPTGLRYNRQLAKDYALEWDGASMIDPNFDFLSNIDPNGGGNAEFINNLLSNQCTLFASSVLYTGGIRDTRVDRIASGGQDYTDIPYWDIKPLMTGDFMSKGYIGNTWYNTPTFYKFLTQNRIGHVELTYSNPPQRYNNDNTKGLRGGSNATEISQMQLSWYRTMKDKFKQGIIQKGDLVFYGSRIGDTTSFYHVAVIVGWGSETYYDIKPDIDSAYSSDELEVLAQYFSCSNQEYKLQPIVPIVVERSGVINYSDFRSLDNTKMPITYLEIVHIYE